MHGASMTAVPVQGLPSSQPRLPPSGLPRERTECLRSDCYQRGDRVLVFSGLWRGQGPYGGEWVKGRVLEVTGSYAPLVVAYTDPGGRWLCGAFGAREVWRYEEDPDWDPFADAPGLDGSRNFDGGSATFSSGDLAWYMADDSQWHPVLVDHVFDNHLRSMQFLDRFRVRDGRDGFSVYNCALLPVSGTWKTAPRNAALAEYRCVVCGTDMARYRWSDSHETSTESLCLYDWRASIRDQFHSGRLRCGCMLDNVRANGHARTCRLGGTKLLVNPTDLPEGGFKVGFVYVLESDALPGYVKIGRTTRSPSDRAAELSSGLPVPYRVAHFEHVSK
jgi:hypothetical protein